MQIAWCLQAICSDNDGGGLQLRTPPITLAAIVNLRCPPPQSVNSPSHPVMGWKLLLRRRDFMSGSRFTLSLRYFPFSCLSPLAPHSDVCRPESQSVTWLVCRTILRLLTEKKEGCFKMCGTLFIFPSSCTAYRDGEVPKMTNSPQSTSSCVWKDLAPGTGPQYKSLLCLSRKNRTSSLLQALNFRGLVWTVGTVLPVLPMPDCISRED